MKVLLVEPNRIPREIEIPNTLEAMQKVVGGPIEAMYPFPDKVAIICNEEGKIDCLPPNRMLKDDSGSAYDIIAGNFFICGLGEDNYTSLRPRQMDKFKELFICPEKFAEQDNHLNVIKVHSPEVSAELKKMKEKRSKQNDGPEI